MAKITIDANSRLVSAADLQFSKRAGAGKAPIDFARDHIVILDPATNRPVAECWPVEREAGAEPPRPVLVGAVPRSAVPANGEARSVPAGFMGPLTGAQKELLERLWLGHPRWPASQVAEAFEGETGRHIRAETAEKFRPAPTPAAGDPSPAELEAVKAKIRAAGGGVARRR